jgi:hypothetical protein
MYWRAKQPEREATHSVQVVSKTKKVKCTFEQALRLCTGRTAHRGSRGIALLFHNHGTRRGWGVSVTPRPLFTPGKYPVPTVGPRAGLERCGKSRLTGIRSPDRAARNQSLYRLRYLAHHLNRGGIEILQWVVTVLEQVSTVLQVTNYCWIYCGQMHETCGTWTWKITTRDWLETLQKTCFAEDLVVDWKITFKLHFRQRFLKGVFRSGSE